MDVIERLVIGPPADRDLPFEERGLLGTTQSGDRVGDRVGDRAVILYGLFFFIALLWPATVFAQIEPPPPNYVGTQACVECHGEIVRSWETSHHALAWAEAREDTVLGDFENAEHAQGGTLSRFTTKDGEYWITVSEKDGVTRRYKVHSVAGIAPLQQVLLEGDRGQLQSFDVAWDAEKERWYSLYPDQELWPDNGLHWTGPYKNWNARCAECHATGKTRRDVDLPGPPEDESQ